MTSNELCTYISRTLPPLFECSPAPYEGVRVRTPLLYPDGGIVDVFVLERSEGYLITDHADALGWLSMQSISSRRTRRQQLLVQDVCQTLGLELHRGQLTLRIGVSESLGDAVLRVAQAVVRVSDLWFTLRGGALNTTADEVDEWLHEKDIPFERDVRKPGRSGENWIIDYETHIAEQTSLVFLLSTGSRSAARRISEHVLAGCIDLSHLKATQTNVTFVSLFDDLIDVWREENFRMVNEHSEIARWSNPDEFESLLRAS